MFSTLGVQLQFSQKLSHPALTEFLARQKFDHMHLDIGCGRGGFLIEAAKQHRSRAYVGIEINETTCDFLAHRINRLSLPNAIVINEEGYNFIRTYVASACIQGLHVYFPTPYLNGLNANLSGQNIKLETLLLVRDFLVQCKRVLCESGSLQIVTDVLRYIERARREALSVGMSEIPWVPPIQCANLTHIIGTGCEIEMQSIGRPVYALNLM